MVCQRLFVGVAVVAASIVAGSRPATGEDAVTWRRDLDAAKIEAIQSHKLLLLHFWTKSCGPCRVLDQQVFNQPQVGDAIERNYVPVKVDADASPALASQFRIDRVPTDVILTGEGRPVAALTCPNTPDAYLAQLQNVAQHVRQAAPVGNGAPSSGVNPAYANLPVAGAQSAAAGVAAQSQQAAARATAPQVQGNPYMAGSPQVAGTRYGVPPTAQPGIQGGLPPAPTAAGAGVAYAATRPAYPPTTPAFAPPAPANSGPAPQQATAGVAPATGQAALPANAMPNSYRAAPQVGQVPPPTTATPPALGARAPLTAQAAIAPPPVTAKAPVSAAAGAAKPASPVAPPSVAAPAAAVAVQAAAPKLPPNSPPLGFDGCCPVTLKTLTKWAPGNPEFGVVHRGRTYLFVGAKERDQFLADPDAYSPVFAGMDPVLLLEQRKLAAGQRKFGYNYGGSFYLFSSAETMNKFAASPQSYAAGVRQAMNRLDAPNGIVRR